VIRQDEPLIIAAGVLTEEEFASLKPEERVEVEQCTRDLAQRYGVGSLRRERERHRTDLDLAYGVPDAC